MSSLPHPSPASSGHGRRRPGALRTLLAGGTLAALAAALGAVLVFAGGREMAESNVADIAGVGTAELGEFGALVVDERQDQLAGRAVLALICAVALAAFTLLARNAATWARVLLTLTAAASLLVHAVIVGDEEPASVMALSAVSLACACVAMVAAWLPATHRFARDKRHLRTTR